MIDAEKIEELRGLLAKATPGPWHHCQPYMTVPAQRTVHGPIPAERVDYVSTWPDKGTPSGHRVVIDMPGRECRVRSEDMALIAAMRNALPDLLARIRSLASENAGLRVGIDDERAARQRQQRSQVFERQTLTARAEAAETEVERLMGERDDAKAGLTIAANDFRDIAGYLTEDVRDMAMAARETALAFIEKIDRSRATLEGRDG